MFEARDLPTVIWLRDEPIVGPFCRHCGYPLTMHADDLRCRLLPHPLFPSPCCDCHAVQRVTRTIMVRDPAYVARRRRRRETVERLEIVRLGTVA